MQDLLSCSVSGVLERTAVQYEEDEAGKGL